MSKTYLSNAFSLQMIPTFPVNVHIKEMLKEHIIALIECGNVESHVGHATFAAMLTKELNNEVAFNRVPTCLQPGDVLLVCQYCGGRLPEGVTELPDNPPIKYLQITYGEAKPWDAHVG